MVGPFGFDVSAFIPRQGSPAVDMAKAAMLMNAESGQTGQRMVQALLHQKAQREAIASDEAQLADQLAEQGRQADMQEYGLAARETAKLQQEYELDQLTRDAKQREIEGALVGDAGAKFGVGDTIGLEALRGKAAILAPQLKFQMPGAPTPVNEMGIADPFGVNPGLNIMRGDETLYSGDTADMRRRNQETARAGLKPFLSGSEGGSYQPAVESAVSMAGLGGISGVDAVRMGMHEGSAAAHRTQSGLNSQSLSVSRNDSAQRADAGMENQRTTWLHGAVEKVALEMQKDVTYIKAMSSIQNANSIEAQIASGQPWSQNMSQLQLLKANVAGAASDKDLARVEGAAGFLNQLESKLNYYISRKEMPAGLQEDIIKGMDLVRAHNQNIVNQSGIAARDHIYSAPGIMARFQSPEEAAYYAVQAYHNVTHDSPTQEEIAQEAQRITPAFMQMKTAIPAHGGAGGGRGGAGGGASVRMGGQIVDPALVSELGGLGVAPLPPKPSPQQAPDDAAAMDLLRGNGRP